jgi:hypothetical protein
LETSDQTHGWFGSTNTNLSNMNHLSRDQSRALQASLGRHVSQDLSDLPGFIVFPHESPHPARPPVKLHGQLETLKWARADGCPIDEAAAELVAEYSQLSDEQLRAQLLTQLAQCDAVEADNPLRAQRAADRVLGPDRAASGPNRSTDRVSGRSVDSRLGVPPVRMPAVSRASGWTEEQLLAQRAKWAAEDRRLGR